MTSEAMDMTRIDTKMPGIQRFASPKTPLSVSLPKGRFPVIVAHIIMAATMNSAGIVKFRKLSMPMISVKATATIT